MQDLIRPKFGRARRVVWTWAAASAAALLCCFSRAADRLERFDLRDVKVGGEIGRRIDVTVQNNLLKLNLDQDFLKPFRQRTVKGDFTGLGMLIDAAVRLAAYTGDAQVIQWKQNLVREALKTQEPDGYLGAFAPEVRITKLWDVHELVYVVYGLTSDYTFFQEQASLDAARRLADYVIQHWPADPSREPGGGITTHMAVTGLERALLTLATVTGDPRYRDFCTGTRKLCEWDLPIVRGRWGKIEGHAFAYFAHALAQTQLYRSQPDARLLRTTRRAMDFLTSGNGLVISGACGDHECWHETQSGTTNLGETCATAYLIRVLDDLLCLEGDSRWGDIMERSIYNALFGAQAPDGSGIRYYTPFECARQYYPRANYCCPNNYRRIIGVLPSLVYYRGPRELTVNLYAPSTVQWNLGGGVRATVRQETDYPNSGRVAFAVEPAAAAEFVLRLRIPRWCPGATASVNGQKVECPAGGGYCTIKRTWQPGDRVALDLPMAVRLVRGRVNQAGRVAVMRGPIVFGLNRQRNKSAEGIDLRLVTLDPASVQEPTTDDAVRPGGLACTVRTWKPGEWYPAGKTGLPLVLTEFPDPGCSFTYFHVPNPNDERFVDDELFVPALPR